MKQFSQPLLHGLLGAALCALCLFGIYSYDSILVTGPTFFLCFPIAIAAMYMSGIQSRKSNGGYISFPLAFRSVLITGVLSFSGLYLMQLILFTSDPQLIEYLHQLDLERFSGPQSEMEDIPAIELNIRYLLRYFTRAFGVSLIFTLIVSLIVKRTK